MILVSGKGRSHRAPNLGCRGAESPGWLDVLPENLHMRCDAWRGVLSWWSCQSPVAHSCGLLNHPNSFCGWVFKLNATFDADSLLYTVTLNVVVTQYTCSLSGVYHPHWLVQWSHPCSHMHIPVLSPWLPGYTDVTQTILVQWLDFFQADLVQCNYLWWEHRNADWPSVASEIKCYISVFVL